MASYRYSICEPLNPTIIEKGLIGQNEIISTFSSFPWDGYLEQMEIAKENDIFNSPSIEFENKANLNGITLSIVGRPGSYEFYIFYKRPKTQKTFFGLRKKINNGYLSSLEGQSEQDAIKCLNALIKNDLDFLEEKFK